MASLQKISPHLWFNTEAEQAVNFYANVFKNSSIGRRSYYTKEGFEIHKMPEGTLLSIEFSIEGQDFVAINGGPIFKFNEAISFIIHCDTQPEIDYYWEKLSEGGDKNAQVCGWLKDKFGLSWQVVPVQMAAMMADTDTEKVSRVMHEMFKMKKLDIQILEKAYTNNAGEKVAETV